MRCTSSIAGLWALLLALLGGCSAISGAPERVTSADALTAEDPAYKAALDDFYRQTDEVGRQRVRNQFVETRIAVVDHEYLKFRQSLYERRVGSALGTDLALMSLGGLGAAVSSAGAKTTYAALSAAVVGGKASVDKNVYFERTVSALLSQMDTLRNKKKIELFDGLALPITNYPLSYAKAQTDEYYLAGTIAQAIMGVNAETAVASQATERELIRKNLERRGFSVTTAKTTDAGEKLEECYSDEANKQSMNDFLKEIGYPKSMSEFTADPATVEQRVQLLERMQTSNRCR